MALFVFFFSAYLTNKMIFLLFFICLSNLFILKINVFFFKKQMLYT